MTRACRRTVCLLLGLGLALPGRARAQDTTSHKNADRLWVNGGLGFGLYGFGNLNRRYVFGGLTAALESGQLR
jgi:hypothetical protein